MHVFLRGVKRFQLQMFFVFLPFFKIQWSTLKKGGLVQGPDDWPVCIAGEGDAMDDDMSL